MQSYKILNYVPITMQEMLVKFVHNEVPNNIHKW